eukprot:CAMPEP_0116888698 /NCGR_PEP_ID=MMETSP0463-20121206/23854_1 /TAXON_ID=181622 /ORGANISM="Strombidinopsis sp, Strain SopsisLIS2011" /LENGTH=141 /DNA_ID=CAMNT_0004553991 /DNA_START=478 /DNA_END=903 /DNA_ORIENTATION=-
MIDQLKSRKGMSAIVYTSSVAGSRPIPGTLTYSATKAFATYLGRGLHWELKGKIDVLAWAPGYISTKMTLDRPTDMLSTTDTRSGNLGMMRELGKESWSFGHWKHKLTGFGVTLFPDSILGPNAIKDSIAQYEKYKKYIED